MSLFSTLYGSGAGAPIGAIITGNISPGGDWLPLDGAVYNRADYPELDVSKMLTFDGNALITGVTLPSGSYKVFHMTGDNWYAYNTTGTQCHRSSDNGLTWSTGTLPQNPGSAYYCLSYSNGLFFLMHSATSQSANYYTSSDGLSWTSRSTLPVLNGYYQSYGTVCYISGRYVALPTYTPAAAGAAHSIYSPDGISWSLSNIGLSSSGSSLSHSGMYSSTGGRVDVSSRQGILHGVAGSTSTPGQVASFDGLNWLQTPHINSAGSLLSATTQTYVDLTSTDDYAFTGGSQIRLGGYSRAVRNVNTLGLFKPGRATNIAIGQGFSEDFGCNRHGLLSGIVPDRVDFSGSRLVSISTSGVVNYMNISSTKFRAVRPIQDTELPLVGQNLYIKAR